MLRIPRIVDSQLTDVGEVVKPYAPAQEGSWYMFLIEAE
jgi:hypothetical protein